MNPPCSVVNSAGIGCKNDARGGMSICSTHRNRILRHGDVQADRPIRRYTVPDEAITRVKYDGATEAERLWGRISRRTDHWLWMGSMVDGRTPQANWNGFNRGVGRIIWELTFGPVPQGARVQRTCDVTRCVNPKHLTLIGAELRAAA